MMDGSAKQYRRLITVRQVAAKIGKSVSSVWNDVNAGHLPRPVKIGGSTRWDEREIDDVIDRMLADRDHAA
jgi:predicted DNA-binding transcriptional regulator AlpA